MDIPENAHDHGHDHDPDHDHPDPDPDTAMDPVMVMDTVDHHALLQLDPNTLDRLMLKSAYTGLQQAYANAQAEHIRVDALLVQAQLDARQLTLQVRALVDLILEKKPGFRRSNPNQRHQTTAPPPPPATANGTGSANAT